MTSLLTSQNISYLLVVSGVIGIVLISYSKKQQTEDKTLEYSGVVLVVMGIIGLYMIYANKKNSGAENFATEGTFSSFISRPSFNTNPALNTSTRFDPNGASANYIRSNGNMYPDMLATTNQDGQPLNEYERENYEYIDEDTANTTDFANFADFGKKSRTKNSSSQDDSNLPSDMLPSPDMRNTLSKDPSDPNNFIYDRTLFAPLKSRSRNAEDRIRGSIPITPAPMLSKVSSSPHIDLAVGYLDSEFSKDITEQHDLDTVTFSRSRNSEDSHPDIRFAKQKNQDDSAWGGARAHDL